MVSPIFGSGLGNRWSISRPTIIATSVCSVTSAIGRVPISAPSRSTVTRSASSKISGSLWLT